MHHLMGLVPPDQSALSLGRPLCVRRGSRGLQFKQGRYLTTRGPVGVKPLAPDLRDWVPVHGKLTECSAPTSEPTGGLVGGMSKTAMQPRGAPK